jgi:hypothetical protein
LFLNGRAGKLETLKKVNAVSVARAGLIRFSVEGISSFVVHREKDVFLQANRGGGGPRAKAVVNLKLMEGDGRSGRQVSRRLEQREKQ